MKSSLIFLLLMFTNSLLAQKSSSAISTLLISCAQDNTSFQKVTALLRNKGAEIITVKKDILTWNNVSSDNLINAKVVTLKDENTHYRLFFSNNSLVRVEETGMHYWEVKKFDSLKEELIKNGYDIISIGGGLFPECRFLLSWGDEAYWARKDNINVFFLPYFGSGLMGNIAIVKDNHFWTAWNFSDRINFLKDTKEMPSYTYPHPLKDIMNCQATVSKKAMKWLTICNENFGRNGFRFN